MKPRVITSALAILFCQPISSGFAQESFRVCIGEDGNKCPVAHTAFFGCGTSYEAAAISLCTLKEGGSQRVLPYQLIPQGTHEGGNCGYAWFEVNCDTFVTDHRVCIGQFPNKCPVAHTAFFGCGTSFDSAAVQLCTIVEGANRTVLPYQVTPQGSKEGNSCGYGWAAVTCQ